MQTTKWGPSGWRFFSSIVFNYSDHPTDSEKRIYKCFFCHAANILPCIYCRHSYRLYMAELPIKDYLENSASIRQHQYLFHNKVNDKLRGQGYLTTPDPPFSQFIDEYDREREYDDCGWDFLYSIVFNYPEHPSDLDRYNYRIFFDKLRHVLPYEPVRKLYEKLYRKNPVDEMCSNEDDPRLSTKNCKHLADRGSLIAWFYNLHKEITKELKIELESYEILCTKYESFRAGCSISNTNSCRLPIK
jgi:hypothetical protein